MQPTGTFVYVASSVKIRIVDQALNKCDEEEKKERETPNRED